MKTANRPMLHYALGAAACAVFAVSAALAGPVPTPTDFVLPLELMPERAGAIQLEPDTASVRAGPGDELQRVHLAVQWKYYDARWVRAHDGRAETISQRIQSFLLVPTADSPSEPYTWAMWWNNPPGVPLAFWLFDCKAAQSYLLFSDGPGLYLADVTQARDPVVAFHEDIGSRAPRSYERVPVNLVGEKMRALGGEYSWSLNTPLVEPISLVQRRERQLDAQRQVHPQRVRRRSRQEEGWQLDPRRSPTGQSLCSRIRRRPCERSI